MSDDSTAPADLSSPGIDLSQIFRPSWTVESHDSTARLASKFDTGDRVARHGRDDGGRGGKRDRDRGPRRDREPRGGQGDRRPRPEGRRGRDETRDRRPEPAPKPMLEGWQLSLKPEAAAIEGIAKQIRSRAKAYPLFELARLIVGLSDRYNVVLKADGEEAPPLFRARADGSLWTTRKEALSHLLTRHITKFYRRIDVSTEPPKGSYSVVAECGMSGTLLGPPNHHEYTSRLIALHSSRFKHLPFEVYKSRIRMVRDEALMERWKTEQSTKTLFIPIEPGSEEVSPDVAEGTLRENTPEQIEGTPVSEPAAEGAGDSRVPDAEISATEEAPSEEIAETPAPPAADDSVETPASGASEPAETSENADAHAEGGLSYEEAAAHFEAHHAASEVEESPREITLEGRVALHGSTPLLRELLLKNLQELDRFPLPIAQVLGKELTSRGLQLFKAQKKIILVSMVRPKYLDRSTTPIAEGFRAILDYLEAHPKQTRDKQWTGLLAQRTETAEGGEADAGETLVRREQALGADLLWLLHQGHVIDFAMGNLQAATPPAPKQPAQSSKKDSAAAESTDGAVIGNSEEVIVSGSAEHSEVGESDMISSPSEAAAEAPAEATAEAASSTEKPSGE